MTPSVSELIASWRSRRDRHRPADEHTALLAELQRGIEKLHERLDFIERALTRGRAAAAAPPKHKTPV